MKIPFYIISISVVILACHSKQSFSLEKNRIIYQETANCIVEKYRILIIPPGNAVSIYADTFQKYGFCKKIDTLFALGHIDFVTLYSDSTVTFYTMPDPGIKSKQHILFYSSEIGKALNKITTDMEIKSQDSNFIEVEKVISLAN